MTLIQKLKIEPAEILWVASDINYCRIYFENATNLLVCSTLKNIELLLKKTDSFLRVHRGFLINKAFLDKIDYNNREVKIKNTTLPISRRRMEHVKEVVQKIDSK